MCIIHNGLALPIFNLEVFEHFSPVLNFGGKLIGLNLAIPYEIIH